MTGPGPDEELADLRQEVATLRAQLAARPTRRWRGEAVRRTAAALLAAVAAVALVASLVGVWTARTAFNTDRWVATVAPLPKDPQVAKAVATYLTTEVAGVLDVDDRLREVLPAPAAFVIGPLGGQVRQYVEQTVEKLIQSDRFQQLWIWANRQAHAQMVAILRNSSDTVAVSGDRVSIDLLPLVNQVLRALSDQLPTLFGHQISLPDLTSGEIPANLRAIVATQLGITLPANFAQFTVYDGGRLRAIQGALVQARRDLALLLAGTALMLILALVVSPGRRRTLLQLGLWLVVAAVAVTAGLRLVRGDLLERVPAGVYRDGVSAAVHTVLAGLRTRGIQVIVLGAALALVMYLVGPGRVPNRLRHAARGAAAAVPPAVNRTRAYLRIHVPGGLTRHRDAARVGGVVIAAVVALLLSSWVWLIVVAVALALYEVTVTAITSRG